MNSEFNKLLIEKDYLIKAVINKLHIYDNYSEFYHVGTIALYKAFKKYDVNKTGRKSFEIYAYYTILNTLKNELTRINRYKKIEMCIDLYQNEYLAPIIEDDLLKRLEMEDLLKNLTYLQQSIINLKLKGYKNKEIGKLTNTGYEQVKYQLKQAFYKIRDIINKSGIH